MPKRFGRPKDINQAAFSVVEQVIAKTEGRPSVPPRKNVTAISNKRRKNPAAVALGRMGGAKSRAGRMEKIAPEDRRRYAQGAARARWAKEKGDS